MEKVIKKVKLLKPTYYRASALHIAKMASEKLRSHSLNEEAREVCNKITGATSIEEAYLITSKYVEWTKRYGN
ncbi:hypothetical protein Q0P22_13890 [Staphylococcus aureus]|nr:hypothetical protein [Staphylococcus aureus]MDN8977715.1 hypothetical protein [Staphylococcus aureus]